ncbi:MAG: hypothetical protein [Caudoviricetes sp.]|nr:MAG: hypothetical protein [Caudoviricetes sp.]
MNILLKIACTAVIIDCVVNLVYKVKAIKIDQENKELYRDAIEKHNKAIGVN